MILRGWKGEPWSLELLGGTRLQKGPDLKGGTSDPASYHNLNSWIFHVSIKISKNPTLKFILTGELFMEEFSTPPIYETLRLHPRQADTIFRILNECQLFVVHWDVLFHLVVVCTTDVRSLNSHLLQIFRFATIKFKTMLLEFLDDDDDGDELFSQNS